jgi:hypothetical protein
MKDSAKQQAPKVFIVDDDEAVRNSLRLLVKSVGLPAVTADSAQEFLATYAPADPGCLILDVRMPGLSGIERRCHSSDLYHWSRGHSDGGRGDAAGSVRFPAKAVPGPGPD